MDLVILLHTTTNDTIDFIYGAEGIMGINRGGNVYLFQKNVLGDVTHIYDMDGVLKARYIYDAWGNHRVFNGDGVDITESNDMNEIGLVNPIRYRSYYYDVETGLYYLRARYYDPETGRFISQDDTQFIDSQHLMGLHLYAYCGNNPVTNKDSNGCSWKSFWNGVGNWVKENKEIVIGAALTLTVATVSVATFGVGTVAMGMAVGATIGAGYGATNALLSGDNVAYGAISGACVGMLSGVGGPGVGGVIASGTAAGLGATTLSLIGDNVNNRTKDYQKAAISGLTAFSFSAFGSWSSSKLGKAAPGFATQFITSYITGLAASSYNFIADAIIGATTGG